jgi:hypothetical protein
MRKAKRNRPRGVHEPATATNTALQQAVAELVERLAPKIVK